MADESAVLTIDEAAHYLGISPRTLRDKRYRQKIKAVPVTERRVGYRRATLDAYLEQRERNGN